MNKPIDIDKVREWTMQSGVHYTSKVPPPWEPGDGAEGWVWDTTIFGDWFEKRPNLPYACDPSMERYWCM